MSASREVEANQCVENTFRILRRERDEISQAGTTFFMDTPRVCFLV